MGSKTLLMCNDCMDNGKRKDVINAISNDHNNEQMENKLIRNEKKNASNQPALEKIKGEIEEIVNNIVRNKLESKLALQT